MTCLCTSFEFFFNKYLGFKGHQKTDDPTYKRQEIWTIDSTPGSTKVKPVAERPLKLEKTGKNFRLSRLPLECT